MWHAGVGAQLDDLEKAPLLGVKTCGSGKRRRGELWAGDGARLGDRLKCSV